jgi:hypothetical protein
MLRWSWEGRRKWGLFWLLFSQGELIKFVWKTSLLNWNENVFFYLEILKCAFGRINCCSRLVGSITKV